MRAQHAARLERGQKQVALAARGLWYAGYALKPGLGGSDVVTRDELVAVIRLRTIHSTGLVSLRELLGRDSDSLVDEEHLSGYEAERNLWVTAGLVPPATAIEASIQAFAFGWLRDRIDQEPVIEERNDAGQIKRRTGFSRVTPDYWRALAYNLRFFLEQCREAALADLTVETLTSAYQRGLSHRTTRSQRIIFRVAVRYWLAWYQRTENSALNLEHIAPRVRRSEPKAHGPVFSTAKAHTLIRTLLDDTSPLFNENQIMDFRYRRACLLLLATAARPREVLHLLQDAMVQDREGVYWLRFHRTKTKRTMPDRAPLQWIHAVRIREDAVRWVRELQQLAPREKITSPGDRHGDGLTA